MLIIIIDCAYDVSVYCLFALMSAKSYIIIFV